MAAVSMIILESVAPEVSRLLPIRRGSLVDFSSSKTFVALELFN